MESFFYINDLLLPYNQYTFGYDPIFFLIICSFIVASLFSLFSYIYFKMSPSHRRNVFKEQVKYEIQREKDEELEREINERIDEKEYEYLGQ